MSKELESRIKVNGYMFGLSDGCYCAKGNPQPYGKPDAALMEAAKKVESILMKDGIRSTSKFGVDDWIDVIMY
tara:strand:+ start:30 stop:248 length:219 start_codon:yes stop_codon:yes gene_type:complete